MKGLAIAAVFLAFCTRADAALSPKFADWPRGPEQWLMTAEDGSDWKKLTTDAEAQTFIDLFWARRDPTPGTRANETKIEFLKRVAEADARFRTNVRRGSLTQLGRVFILLGAPYYDNAGVPEAGNGIESAPYYDKDGNVKVADLGHRSAIVTFDYRNPSRAGLTRPYVRFLLDSTTREYDLIIDNNNAVGALHAAVRQVIVNPSLKIVPPWALETSTPQATLPPGDGQPFRVYLAVASASPPAATAKPLPPDVQKAVADLKGFLPYSSYRPVASLLFRCRSGRQWSVDLDGPAGKKYVLSLAFNALETGKLNVYRFDVVREEGPIEPVLSTSFSIGIGETISVGSSRVGGAGDALVFFVTALGK